MHLKKRRGFTSLFETVVALTLTAVLITLLVTLIAYVNIWTLNTHNAMMDKIDTDFFVESIQEDTKSADSAEVIDGKLEIINDTRLVVYSISGDTIYRNTDAAVDKIISGQFSVLDENTIGVYVRFQDGSVIDLLMRR